MSMKKTAGEWIAIAEALENLLKLPTLGAILGIHMGRALRTIHSETKEVREKRIAIFKEHGRQLTQKDKDGKEVPTDQWMAPLGDEGAMAAFNALLAPLKETELDIDVKLIPLSYFEPERLPPVLVTAVIDLVEG
jgi:hypothetical protein